MGAYLSAPVRDKELLSGGHGPLRYGGASMQGWRLSMEDATLALPCLDDDTSLFAIFDGHGGGEVARFAARHLAAAVLAAPGYAKGDVGASLTHALLSLDEKIASAEGREELRQLAAACESPTADAESEFIAAKVRSGLLRHAASLGTSGAELEALSRALERDVTAAAASPRGGADAGAAALVALLRRGVLTVANAGDCRAVLCRAGGAAYPLSSDHKPDCPAEAARIAAAGAYVADGRVNGTLALSRALGDFYLKTATHLPAEQQAITAAPELRAVTLGRGDEFLLLACDGIWDVLSSQQAVDFVRTGLARGVQPHDVAAALCDACMAPDTGGEGLGCDNMSVLIVIPNVDVFSVTPRHSTAEMGDAGGGSCFGMGAACGARGRSGGGGARQAAAAAARAAARGEEGGVMGGARQAALAAAGRC